MTFKGFLIGGLVSMAGGLCSGCATPPPANLAEIPKFAKADGLPATVGCKNLMDHYCSQLYSPTASGNLIIERRKPIEILQGETPNQFDQVFYRYSEAKLLHKDSLPPDFRIILERSSYFEQLARFIHRRPIPQMSLEDRLANEHLDYTLGSLWQSAIEETILSRMSQKYKGFHRIPNRLVPIEYEVEERRIRRHLISEFSKVLWRDDANWRKVMEGFNDLKLSFYALFERLNIPADLREDWTRKIRSVELVLPGSLPEISDEECSTTTINAYYYKHLNIITICAGDFNSEDIILTLAHEMSHSLGLDRGLYVQLQKSALAERQRRIRSNVCTVPQNWSCSEWEEFKRDLPGQLQEIQGYRAPLSDFNRCLKKTEATKTFDESDLQKVAEKISKNRIAGFAGTDLILRLIKEKLPLKNGTMQANPNYMNPCSYYLWSKKEEPIDDEIYSFIYFAAEYRCSVGDQQSRLRNAINVTSQLTTSTIQARLRLEGEFSERAEMIAEGYSSPPFERFADVMGTYVVAEYLKRFPDLWERRTKYLASSSWLCQEPSLESKYPDESQVVMQFSLDPHSQGQGRQLEILSAPIREALACTKDFEFKECLLPLKPGTSPGH